VLPVSHNYPPGKIRLGGDISVDIKAPLYENVAHLITILPLIWKIRRSAREERAPAEKSPPWTGLVRTSRRRQTGAIS